MSKLRSFFSDVLGALRRLLGDENARSTMIVGILIYSVLYPQPYVGEVLRDVPVVVIDQDNSSASRTFVREMDVTEWVDVTLSVSNMDVARDAFFRRDVYGVVVIPDGFEADILASRPSPVAAFGDGSYLLIYSNVVKAVATVAGTMGAQVNYARLTARGVDDGLARTLLSPVAVTSVSVFNPQGGYASYVVPAAFVLILQQTLMMGIGLLHAGRKLPSGRRMWATILAYLGLYLLWVMFTQMLLPFLYSIPRTGDLGTLLLLAVPFLCACIAMGFAIALAIPWREGVVFFLVVMGMPLFFLSGISWPVEMIPEYLHDLSLLVPSSSAISAFVAVDQMGATAHDIAGAIQTQVALAFGYTALAVGLARLTRKTRKQPI
ncbi:ABC transporter permease [Antarcticimicrobium sediminis]|uniref:ABC transporter permease n=1 Tax=Antarcticimicrobium sediminis TaxID=2546227 RepID=UPI0019D091AE|nr:ABC transporter permease [Antarcticimicrobium sediminis]